MLTPETLSLADLDAFDPQPSERGNKRHYCCPLDGPCSGKTIDRSHQKLTVFMDSGGWNCIRCGQTGKLREWWTDRPLPTRRERHATALQRAYTPPPPPPAPVVDDGKWRRCLDGLVRLEGSPGAEYLESRGIPLDLAVRAHVRYHPAWEHWEKEGEQWKRVATSRRVVFAVRDTQDKLVAVQARAIGPDEYGPKAITKGKVELGAFATPGAWKTPARVLVEAPIDALSLHLCGAPALATLGCNLPAWMPADCAYQPVFVGTDADEAGDRAAEKWAARLQPLGAEVTRLRPEGGKDFNAVLLVNQPGLTEFIINSVRARAEAEIDGLLAGLLHAEAMWYQEHPDKGLDRELLTAATTAANEAAYAEDLPALRAACRQFRAVLQSSGLAQAGSQFSMTA